MEEEKVIIKGLKINYKVIGQGRPMLVLHGWGSSSDRWQKVGHLLAERGFAVIIPDLPGFGKSQEPQTVWNLDAFVEWLYEFSQSVSQLQGSFYLAGHSFGGAISAKFAIKYNQKVEKLFLIAAACIRIKTPSKSFFANISRFIKIFYFFPFYETLRKHAYKIIFYKSDYPYVSGIMKEIYLRAISDDLLHKLIFLKVPTVIIWGDRDSLTPVEHAHIINKKIPGSKLEVVPGAGHNLHSEGPEILTEKISEHA